MEGGAATGFWAASAKNACQSLMSGTAAPLGLGAWLGSGGGGGALGGGGLGGRGGGGGGFREAGGRGGGDELGELAAVELGGAGRVLGGDLGGVGDGGGDRKSTRLNSSHSSLS